MNKFSTFIVIACSLLLCSCCKDIDANPQTIDLLVGEQTQITTNNQKVSFSSENNYFASVDESGIVTANKVGSTNIAIESKKEIVNIPVNINPQYTYFDEPFIEFGSPLNKVVEKYGECFASLNGSYTYTNYGPNNAILVFSFKEGKLVTVKVTLSSKDSNNNVINIDGYMLERYNETASTDKVQIKNYTNDLNGQTPASISVFNFSELNIIDIEYTLYISE